MCVRSEVTIGYEKTMHVISLVFSLACSHMRTSQ